MSSSSTLLSNVSMYVEDLCSARNFTVDDFMPIVPIRIAYV